VSRGIARRSAVAHAGGVVWLVSALSFLGLAACGTPASDLPPVGTGGRIQDAGSGSGPTETPPPPPPQVYVYPPTAVLGPTGVCAFGSNTRVQWSVQEAGGGSVTGEGVYTAPGTPGVFHVVATDPSGAFQPATATVTVVSSGFTIAGKTTVVRWQPTATLLPDATVLIAGGDGLGTAELFDPATGTSTPTGRMSSPRSLATATLLSTGQVLITGGEVYSPARLPLATAEVYDPATGSFTAVGEMTRPRSGHMATLLRDGRVLVIGGAGDADLYDPVTSTFAPTTAFSSNVPTTTTVLPGGAVLAIGTFGAELFDPQTGAVTTTGPMTTSRNGHTATLLPTGKVLIAGGDTDAGVGSSEIYDPSSGTFAPGPSLLEARADHLAILLPSGAVLLAGGLVTTDDGCGPEETTSAELLDPALGAATVTGSMAIVRSPPFPFTALQDGGVLVLGEDPYAGTVEVYR